MIWIKIMTRMRKASSSPTRHPNSFAFHLCLSLNTDGSFERIVGAPALFKSSTSSKYRGNICFFSKFLVPKGTVWKGALRESSPCAEFLNFSFDWCLLLIIFGIRIYMLPARCPLFDIVSCFKSSKNRSHAKHWAPTMHMR